MQSDPRALLGDLVVATVELARYPERWLRLAHATCAELRTAALPHDLLAELVASLDLAAVRALARFWPFSWPHACVVRSAFESLRDLLEARDALAPAVRDALDTSELDQQMGDASQFIATAVPDATPAYHWWWTRARPPGEGATRTNGRMRALLPDHTHAAAPAKLRALLAGGFIEINHLWFLRDHQPTPIPSTTKAMHATYTEAFHNALPLHDILEPAAARPLGELAAIGLASARWMAHEVRRRNLPPFRICLLVDGAVSQLTFHRVRPRQDWIEDDGRQSIEVYKGANLALDTHD